MSNVVDLPVITSLPLDPERMLRKALEAGLTGVVILGEMADGGRYFASSISDGPEVLWLLKKAERERLDQEDRDRNLNEARAIRDRDARKWTAVDALKAALRDLENGECRPIQGVYIAMVRLNEETRQAQTFPFYTGGLTALEIRGVLAQHLDDLCAGR